MATRVAVIGAAGRMGREVCGAVAGADDLELVAAVDPHHVGSPARDSAGTDLGIAIGPDLEAVTDARATVAVEFSGPATVADNTLGLMERGIHAVVGATGLTSDARQRIGEAAASGPANAFIAPNFAIGAVLMMQFAAQAARHLDHVEVVELHHDRKVDAPSGTALRTAELIAEARGYTPDVPLGDDEHPGARGTDHHGLRVHSVRLPGLVAHQEVIFGGQGQTLTIRHDSIDRTSFMPGVLLACRRVGDLDGLVVGLEHLL